MKRYQREIVIAQPVDVVFDFFADMSRLVEWAGEDFASVRREGDGAIGLGSSFAYVTKGARAESSFAWTTFARPTELVFSGPRVDVGPGWVEGLGGYRFVAEGTKTRVTAWFEPKLGGFLALMSPFARMRNIRLLGHQLAHAKMLIETGRQSRAA